LETAIRRLLTTVAPYVACLGLAAVSVACTRKAPRSVVAPPVVAQAVTPLAMPAPAPATADTAVLHRAAAPDDVTAQGWQTEAMQDAAAKQLKVLAHALADTAERDEAHLGPLLTATFGSTPLRPANQAMLLQHPWLQVTRATLPAPQDATDGGQATALARLQAQLAQIPASESKFKIFRVEPGTDGGFSTRVWVQIWAMHAQASDQIDATWQIDWQPGGPSEGPRMRRLTVLAHQEAHATWPGGTQFAEISQAVLAGDPSWTQQLLHGIDYWLERLDVTQPINPYGHFGGAVGDVDGDGRDDVYVCQSGGLPNRLFVHQPDGTVRDIAAQAGVDLLDPSAGALILDLDNDGDQDLAVQTSAGLALFANDGHARFSSRGVVAGTAGGMGLTAADVDLDGDLDLYVSRYQADASQWTALPAPQPFHDANNGGANVLLRNDRDFRFTDVTVASGLDVHNRRYTFAAVFEDVDEDGDADLYVANDFGRKNLYRNDSSKTKGLHFVDVAAQAGVEDTGAGMSASFADYDQDGHMDLYVGDMWSSAGGRIAYQDRFVPGQGRQQVQRFAKGSSLFRNLGNGRFGDVSVETGVEFGRWAWSSPFVDLDNDGREDIVIANGFLSRPEKPDL
jgi:hypothetical protein